MAPDAAGIPAQFALYKAVSEASDIEEGLGTLLAHICRGTGWVLGQAWFPGPDEKLHCHTAHFMEDPALAPFRNLSVETLFPPGIGLPGRVWSSRSAAWVKDVRVDKNFPRAPVARDVGLAAAVGVPVLAGDEVVAVLEFFLRQVREEDAGLVELVAASALPLGTLIQRRRADAATRESEERFRSVAESAQEAILTANAHGVINYANAGATRLFGRAADELLGASLTILMPERFRAAHTEGLARFLRTGQARVLGRTVELAGLRKDGTEFPIELSLSQWTRGGDVYFTGIIRDVTGRKASEEALRSLRVARPLVRRIVRDLIDHAGVDRQALSNVGGRLAAAVDAKDIEGHVRAFSEMGLGNLQLADAAVGRWIFEGHDLLERQEGARLTTCYLAEGFLRGAVAKAMGLSDALGTEVACESRGDTRCRFVVSGRVRAP